MVAAAAGLPRPPLYGIGSCRVGPEYLDFEIGWDEFERDTDWAEAMLRSAGLDASDMVLVTSPSWENPWTSPVVHALRRMAVTYSFAEVYGWDARRVSMFLQRLPIKALLGLGAETVTALAAEQPVADVLRNVEIVWARHDALAQLASVAAEVVGYVPLGPALAMGLPGRRGVTVNAKEWTLETDGAGQLLVSSAGSRTTAFDRVTTGIRGTIRSVDDDAVTIDLDDPTTA